MREPPLRTLAITQNITVDGSIEMLGDWFDPHGGADVDNSGLLEEMHRLERAAARTGRAIPSAHGYPIRATGS